MKRSIILSLTPYASGGKLIDPADPQAARGGGGSRAGFMGLVRALGRLGKYDVGAVSTFARQSEEIDGVFYARLDPSRAIPPADVHLAYYDTTPLVQNESKLRVASHHTCTPPFDSWMWADVNTAPCQWAVDWLRRGYRPHGRWEVLPNAVEGLEGVVREPVPGKIVYHTSADRGLHRLLLDVYPEVKRRVPHATLDVVGDLRYVKSAASHPQVGRSYEGERARAVVAGLRKSEEAGGLKVHAPMTRPELLRLLGSASCFAFPAEVSMPCETWSVSVHECLAIGLPVVLTPVDAFESLWGGLVSMAGDTEAFVECVVRVLTDEEYARHVSAKGKLGVAGLTFDRSAEALDRIVEGWFAGDRNSSSETAAAE